MSTDTLKPCPWCGGRALAYDVRETHGICTVECTGCNADRSGDTPELAAEAWNRRASPSLDVSTEIPKPCPFCGDSKSDIDIDDKGDDWACYTVRCTCGGEGPTRGDSPTAIAAWNRRSALMSNAAPEVDRSAVRREALEEAAKICRMNHRHTLSRAIRALADPLQGKETP